MQIPNIFVEMCQHMHPSSPVSFGEARPRATALQLAAEFQRGSPASRRLQMSNPNVWAQLFGKAPTLGRPLRVALPCCGIDACGVALDSLGVRWQACYVYDIEHRYEKYLKAHFSPAAEGFCVGDGGDVTRLSAEDLTRHGPVDFLVSGPPCPPWATCGKRNGTCDYRACVFAAVLKMMVAWIQRGWLLGVVLENVMGTMQGGQDAFMKKVQRTLQEEVTDFVWNLDVLAARDYKLAQNRCRVFLRGMRRSWCGGQIPPPVGPLGPRTLVEFLDPRAPHTCDDELTPNMQNNLSSVEAKVEADQAEGLLDGVVVVMFHVDRDQTKRYLSGYMKDCCYTLTTANKYLFVLSVHDIKLPRCQRAFCRFLSPGERLVLQGFPPDTAKQLGNDESLIAKAAGNAYPVPLIAAVLKPMIQAIDSSSKSLGEWPTQSTDAQEVDLTVIDALFAQERSVMKRPASQKGADTRDGGSSKRVVVTSQRGQHISVNRSLFASSSSSE